MPILSDFEVIETNKFLTSSQTRHDINFGTGGRHNSHALLDIEILGGYRGDDSAIAIRIDLNGTHLTNLLVRRWQDHSVLDYARRAIRIPHSRLKASGTNLLRIQPTWEGSSDYLFIGTTVVHFHQRD